MVTLPYERRLAIANVRRWLTDIMLGPRMPTRKLRHDARRLLKHYPTDLDMEDPGSIFGDDMPPNPEPSGPSASAESLGEEAE